MITKRILVWLVVISNSSLYSNLYKSVIVSFKLVLFLIYADVLHVLNREARARKFAFQILGTGCKYHLATESGGDRERWVRGLEGLLFGPPQPGIVCE